jgi:hypothetical protein
VANERPADSGGCCARTLFALHDDPLCSFLPHFARESGSMFLQRGRGRACLLQDPCQLFVPSIAGLALPLPVRRRRALEWHL